MKHILSKALIAILFLSISSVNAQNLQKANKEFELYAFNLAIKSYRTVLESEPHKCCSTVQHGNLLLSIKPNRRSGSMVQKSRFAGGRQSGIIL